MLSSWKNLALKPLRRLLSPLAASVFPDLCPLCREPLPQASSRFCAICEANLVPISRPFCPCCGEPFAAKVGLDHLCGRCLKHQPPFARARAFGLYQGPLAEGIRRFKYRAEFSLTRALTGILVEAFCRAFDDTAYDLIIPVPLHGRRLRSRGFNQAVLLSRGLAGRYRFFMDCRNLQRVRDTASQVGLNLREREKNVKDAFVLKRPERIAGRRVLLVDDVYTTGATVRECARVLKRAKPAGLDVLTLARAGEDLPPETTGEPVEIKQPEKGGGEKTD